jgi:hypothetical protein
MRKTLVAGASLALLLGGTVSAGAFDFTQFPSFQISSTVSAAPAISAGGGQFFPVVSTLKAYGGMDVTGAVIANEAGTEFAVDATDGKNMISGDITYKEIYNLYFVDPTESEPIPVVLSGPMNVGHINFNSASATLDSNDKLILDAVAKEMARTHLTAVYLVGKADPVGTDAGNFAISLKRVNAAASYLRSALGNVGVTDARVTTEYMGSIGATGAEDRRVDITIYPKI